MSDETKSDLDPRFDPAFQRGFDPATPVTPPVRSARSTPAAPPVVRVGPPPAQPVPENSDRRPPESAASETAPAELPSATLDAEQQPAAPGAESAPGRNPFLLILGVVAVILVGVGIWLFMQAGAGFNSREVRSQGDYFSLSATIQVAPFISLLGVATAIGVVFVFAAKWRKRG